MEHIVKLASVTDGTQGSEKSEEAEGVGGKELVVMAVVCRRNPLKKIDFYSKSSISGPGE